MLREAEGSKRTRKIDGEAYKREESGFIFVSTLKMSPSMYKKIL